MSHAILIVHWIFLIIAAFFIFTARIIFKPHPIHHFTTVVTFNIFR